MTHMFKAIGSVILLTWLAAHFTATLSAMDNAGAAVFTAIGEIASNTPKTLAIPSANIPNYKPTSY